MIPTVTWIPLTPATQSASITLPNTLPNTSFLETFCLPDYILSVTFNPIPLDSASISIRPATQNTLSNPSHVHYSPSTSFHEWSLPPRDAHFRFDPTDNCFVADFNLTGGHVSPIGLVFVVQLQNSKWLRARDGKDFYVGGGERPLACAVEMPLPMPEAGARKVERSLSLFRMNPFWLLPKVAHRLEEVEEETVFLLYALEQGEAVGAGDGENLGGKFAAVLPVIDPKRGVRASLFGMGNYVGLRLEHGRTQPLCGADVDGFVACVVGVSNSPYEAVRKCVFSAKSIVGGFCTRLEKLESPRWAEIQAVSMLERLGYCTWDAFGHEVTEGMVNAGLKWLEGEGVNVGYLVVDDGWQGGGGAGPEAEDWGIGGRPRLSSFGANDKFGGSLRGVGEGRDVDVVAWAAMIGYWGGCSSSSCGVNTFNARGVLSVGLWMNEAHGKIDPGATRWEKTFEVVGPEFGDVEEFFERYFVNSMATDQRVAGVKVDAQSILEILCNTNGNNSGVKVTRSTLTNAYRSAMTKAIETAFPKAVVINCMACGPESVLLSGRKLTRANVCWRTSNDHAFPGVEEDRGAVAWHILCNAWNSILLGEIFPAVDWDMFRAADGRTSELHATARVLSGGPIYISDTTPISRGKDMVKKLLSSLTTSNGRLLRCANPGRPSIDCLFQDPRVSPCKLFKIFNRTAVLYVLGLFNLDSSHIGMGIEGSFAPADVDDIAQTPSPSEREYISLVPGAEMQAFRHYGIHDRASITVPPMSAKLAHLCPVFRAENLFQSGHDKTAPAHHKSSVKFAVLGQPRMLNCGATVGSISISTEQRVDQAQTVPFLTIECMLEDFGKTYIWLNKLGVKNVRKMTHLNGNALGHKFHVVSGINFVVADVADETPYGFRLNIIDSDGQ